MESFILWVTIGVMVVSESLEESGGDCVKASGFVLVEGAQFFEYLGSCDLLQFEIVFVDH